MRLKAAFVQSVSLGYLPGTCALLTQLERYGHREDVWILYWDDVDWRQLATIIRRSGYRGKVGIFPIKDLRTAVPVAVPKGARKGWDCRFYKHRFVAHGLDDMDVICFWGGDQLLLGNIHKYLELGQYFTVLSHNPYSKQSMGGSVDFQVLSENSNPYADIPFITSNRGLIARIWEEGQDQSIRERGRGDMLCIHRAILGLGLQDIVFQLPYAAWVRPWLFSRDLIPFEDGGLGFKDKSRVYCVHGKLWSKGHCLKDARRALLPDADVLPFILKTRDIYIEACEICGLDGKEFK